MFRIAVASDSHGDLYAINEFARIAKREADAVCHLGDCADDAEELRRRLNKPFYNVRGNCDFWGGVPEDAQAQLGGISVFMTHGHKYHVKTDTALLVSAAQEHGAKLALFGHTHRAIERFRENVFLINPGALRDGNYAFVDIDEEGTPYATFMTI